MREADRDMLRALRAASRGVRDVKRSLEQMQRNGAALSKRASVLEEKLKKNVIKTLNVRYEIGVGFCSDTIRIEEGKVHFEMTLPATDRPRKFSPQSYEVGAAKMDVLDLMITQWGTIAALRVRNDDRNFQMSLNWVKPRNRANSSIFLLEELGKEYYFPIWTDLTGQLLPNAPRIGLVLFEPFRKPAPKVLLYLRGVRFTVEPIEPELVFRLEGSDLEVETKKAVLQESVAEKVRKQFETAVAQLHGEVNDVVNAVEARASRLQNRSSTGCVIWLIVISFVVYLIARFDLLGLVTKLRAL